MNMKFIQTFSPQQHYIKVNGHPMPLMMDSIGDESVINNLDERKYYVQMFNIKMMGYLLDEEDFEVNPAISRAVTLVEVIDNVKRSQYEIQESEEDKTTEISVIIESGLDNITLPIDTDTRFTEDLNGNVNSVIYEVNGTPKTIPFSVDTGDSLRIIVTKTDISKSSKVIIKGVLLS